MVHECLFPHVILVNSLWPGCRIGVSANGSQLQATSCGRDEVQSEDERGQRILALWYREASPSHRRASVCSWRNAGEEQDCRRSHRIRCIEAHWAQVWRSSCQIQTSREGACGHGSSAQRPRCTSNSYQKPQWQSGFRANIPTRSFLNRYFTCLLIKKNELLPSGDFNNYNV